MKWTRGSTICHHPLVIAKSRWRRSLELNAMMKMVMTDGEDGDAWDGMDRVVQEAWSNFYGGGRPDKRLLRKLKAVKIAIRKWCAVEHEKENKAMQELKQRACDIDREAENRILTDAER
ncbi:hypothetical protein LXL04_033229 [Taraxacum kok-saghyz]